MAGEALGGTGCPAREWPLAAGDGKERPRERQECGSWVSLGFFV